jgi:bacillithiol biosynthesis deacetylase BshB1
MEDVWAIDNQENCLKIVQILRKYRPKVVFCNAKSDRHPDHAKGAEMVTKACFISGLIKIETLLDGKIQDCFRPEVVYNYIQFQIQKPDFIIDISGFEDKKFEAINAYGSQFFSKDSKEVETFISQKGFLDVIRSNDLVLGKSIQVDYAEGFQINRYLGVNDLMSLI